jgi:hypothetical protein
MYDANGRFPVIVTRSDLPKLASNNREVGITEENKAIRAGELGLLRHLRGERAR